MTARQLSQRLSSADRCAQVRFVVLFDAPSLRLAEIGADGQQLAVEWALDDHANHFALHWLAAHRPRSAAGGPGSALALFKKELTQKPGFSMLYCAEWLTGSCRSQLPSGWAVSTLQRHSWRSHALPGTGALTLPASARLTKRNPIRVGGAGGGSRVYAVRLRQTLHGAIGCQNEDQAISRRHITSPTFARRR